jgi:hypothetical protein
VVEAVTVNLSFLKLVAAGVVKRALHSSMSAECFLFFFFFSFCLGCGVSSSICSCCPASPWATLSRTPMVLLWTLAHNHSYRD